MSKYDIGLLLSSVRFFLKHIVTHHPTSEHQCTLQ